MEETGRELQLDEEFLEDLLDRAIGMSGHDRRKCFEGAATRRPDLRIRIDEIARLIEDVAFCGEPALPEIPGFEVVREIGRGGMGIVFEARDQSLRRRVAIKVIAPRLATSLRDRSRFDREAMALARIRHPNIVQVYGSGIVGSCPFIVMEYIEGQRLSTLLPAADSELTRDQVASLVGICSRIARGLDQAHAAGVIHRDVKPGNILVSADGAPTLVDFGLAHESSQETLTQTGEFVGTLNYTAPEQALGKRVDARADVFGLGATLCHSVTGSPPFEAATLIDLVRQIETGARSPAPRSGSRLPRDLATILEHATTPDPRDRYASCADLADDLDSFLDSRPIRVRPPTAVERVFRWVRRRPVAAALVFSLTACIVLLAVISIWWWDDHAKAAAIQFEERLAEAMCLSTFGDNSQAEALLLELTDDHPNDLEVWALRIVNALEEGRGRIAKHVRSPSSMERASALLSLAPAAFRNHLAGVELMWIVHGSKGPPPIPPRAPGGPMSVHPQDLSEIRTLALVLARAEGRNDEANALLVGALSRSSDFRTHLLHASLAADAPSFETLRSAVIAQSLQPRDPAPLFLLARCRAGLARISKDPLPGMMEAVDLARRACALAPRNPRAQSTLGFIAHDIDPAEAERAYRASLALGASGVARWNLNGLLAGQKRLNACESLELLRPIVEDYGHRFDYWRNLAWAEHEINGLPAAIATLERGERMIPPSETYQIHGLLSSYHSEASEDPAHAQNAGKHWDLCFEGAPDDPEGMEQVSYATNKRTSVERLREFVDRCERIAADGGSLQGNTLAVLQAAATVLRKSR